MEWYDWIFAVCGVSTAFALALMTAAIYTDARERGAGKDETRRLRSGR